MALSTEQKPFLPLSPRPTSKRPSSRLAILAALTVLLVIVCLRLSLPSALDSLHSSTYNVPHNTFPPTPPLKLNPPTQPPPSAPSPPTPPSTPPSAPFIAHPTDVCHVIGANPRINRLWQYNSRILCLSSSICFQSQNPFASYLHSSNLTRTKCLLDTPALVPIKEAPITPRDRFHSCMQLQRENVICAHGYGLHQDHSTCPQISPLQHAHFDEERTKWIEDISVLVPAYPYAANIFHYGNVASWFSYVIDALPQLLKQWGLGNVHAPGGKLGYFADGKVRVKNVNLMFRSWRNENAWQDSVLNVMLRRLSRNGFNVTVHYIQKNNHSRHTCLRNAVVLGRRGHMNVWPFPNSTEVPFDGFGVPSDAVAFKRAFYEAYGLDVRLPRRGENGSLISELPPLVVGYSRRMGKKEVGGSVHLSSTGRVFNATDEKWFTDMLRNETTRAGVALHMFTTSSRETLREQVQNIARVGFVVGIHGANLVNSIFMYPFGGLMEILPHGARSFCYEAGSNSGLAYFRHTATVPATPEESGCTSAKAQCHTLLRQRMVKISAAVDREAIRSKVRQGIQRLVHLHKMYPDGIPVRYNRETSYFDIVEVSKTEPE